MQIWRYALAHEVQWVTLSVQGSLVPLAPLPLTTARVGAGALEALAIIKSRLWRLAAAKVGVPVGHGYNYFLACDTAER